MPVLKNKKHELFCNEYIIDCNATRAFGKIYPKQKYNSIRANSSALIAKDNIQERISELLNEKLSKIGVRSDAVLKELAHISFSDITNYVEVAGNTVLLKDFDELDKYKTTAISEVSQILNRDGTANIKFKLYNKISALELLGKYLNIFAEKVDHKFDGSININIITPEKDED